MSTQTTKDLEKLKEKDLISLILFCIYKLSKDPEYSTISELIYVLDKESLYKLCSTFGGCTLKIPTISELKTLTNVLLVYQYVNIDGFSFVKACEMLNVDVKNRKEVLKLYEKVMEIISSYDEET